MRELKGILTVAQAQHRWRQHESIWHETDDPAYSSCCSTRISKKISINARVHECVCVYALHVLLTCPAPPPMPPASTRLRPLILLIAFATAISAAFSAIPPASAMAQLESEISSSKVVFLQSSLLAGNNFRIFFHRLPQRQGAPLKVS